MSTYTDLKKKHEEAKKVADDTAKAADEEIEDFVKKQTFTGEELLKMRDEIKEGNHGADREPWLDYVLERILTYREDNE